VIPFFDSHEVKLLRVLTVDEGLLVDTPDPLQVADIEHILRAAIAGMLALKLAMLDLKLS
jgi:hypothetical protein